jgi:hypothetical protein
MTLAGQNFELNEYLAQFQNSFSKPQNYHFQTLIRGLLFSQRKSVLSYAKASKKDQSSLNRFVNSEAIDDQLLKQTYNSILASNLKSNSESYLIIDDTLKHHNYAKKIFGLGKHHDHLEGGYSSGHCLVTAGVLNNSYLLPTNCELYRNKSDVSETTDFITKIAIAQNIVDQEIHKCSALLIDSWYATKEILAQVLTHNKHFFTMLKSNRNLTIALQKRRVEDWGRTIYPKLFSVIEHHSKHYAVHSKIGYLPKVGKVKVVFIKEYNPITQLSGDIHYLCSSNLELSELEILHVYSKRWEIEVFHRNIKQNLGFEKSMLRKEKGVRRHLFFSKVAYLALTLSSRKEVSIGQSQNLLKKDFVSEIVSKYGISEANLGHCVQELLAVC